jgi:hypothetical protein
MPLHSSKDPMIGRLILPLRFALPLTIFASLAVPWQRCEARHALQEEPAIRSESSPPQQTLYLPIPLGVPSTPAQSTGVFVPENYRAGSTIDLIVFLRGYDIKRPQSVTSVEEYWGSPKHPILKSFQFREELNKSNKNVILVVPTLGPFAEAGNLISKEGARVFLDQVVEGLWKKGPFAGQPNRPTIRHLILAAHSGGGVPLRKLAQILGEDDIYKKSLKACWGFDSIYGVRDRDADFWSNWAATHRDAHVEMYYLFTEKAVGKNPGMPISSSNPFDHRVPSGTTGPALELERLAKASGVTNVAVVRETKESTLDHNEVPRAHLRKLLDAAAYLDRRK